MKQPPAATPSRFERFGLYYLEIFARGSSTRRAFELSDAELVKEVRRITLVGIALSALTGLIFVFPIVYVDLLLENASPWVHWGWVIGVTIAATLVEFYLLFYISLKCVHKVGELVHMEDFLHDSLGDGIFGVKNLLARAALEIPDPELKLLGIDPFKTISRKNLFVLGMLYKGKIIVTNLLLKAVLRVTVGNAVMGISILYIALPVEMFWNGVVIRKVIQEARLRLFGHALANRIVEDAARGPFLARLSPLAKKGCLRAIGNAVVMTRNYHPNMVILLLRFQDLLGIHEEDHYDNWELFLETLGQVSEQERNFLLDLLTVAAAFDGKLSAMEKQHVKEAYQEDAPLYLGRLDRLIEHLREGRLNAALELCRLDFTKG